MAHQKQEICKKKSKSKDNPKSSASRWSGFFAPRTDTEHEQDIGVDDIQDLDYAPIKFDYGKDFLPHFALTTIPDFMKRMHNWYKRACTLGIKLYVLCTIRTYSELKGNDINDIMFDFEDIQNMLRLKELGIEIV